MDTITIVEKKTRYQKAILEVLQEKKTEFELPLLANNIPFFRYAARDKLQLVHALKFRTPVRPTPILMLTNPYEHTPHHSQKYPPKVLHPTNLCHSNN